jgi:tRNA(fMet)-specific endonuclease VapC
MNVALDTNAYSDFMRGVAARVQVVQSAARLFLPLFVLGELRAGFAAGSQQTSNETNLDRLLASPRVTVLLPDEATTQHYARLFLELRQQGTAIPTNDLWIAALAQQHQLTLCTSDTHFQHIKQLATC